MTAQAEPADTTAAGRYALKFSGALNFGGELYGVDGIPNRRSPWSYTTSGRLGLSVGKFRLPISFTYRDRQFAYDFTFNRFGMSPTLGWATLHLGWRNMNFSQYTLGGRTFFGVGTELRPGKFYFGALYGTIQNPLAIRDTLAYGANLIPIFDRKLYGAKVGFRSGKHHLELMGVKIWDDRSTFDYPDDYDRLQGYGQLSPKENLVFGLNGGFEIVKTVELYLRTGVTAFTNDVTDPLNDLIGGAVPDQYRDIITVNSSSRITFAGDAGMNVTIKGSRLGLQYRRVEPFYNTLAASYFYNDVEQYTALLSTGLLQRRLLLNGRFGLERNNLRGYRLNETKRFITNVTASYRPTDDWNWTLRYGNFTTDSDPSILELNDTLRYVTVSTNAGLNGSWTKRGQARDLILSLYTNFQRIDDRSTVERLNELDSYSATLNGAWKFKASELTIGPSLQYHRYALDERLQERFGLGVNVARAFWEKRLQARLSSTLSQNDVNNARDGTVGLHSLTFRLRVGERQSLSLYNSYRHSHSISFRNFREWRSRLRWGLRF